MGGQNSSGVEPALESLHEWVSTISGGNEFQLFTTLILKANISFFTQACTSKLFELL